MKKLLLVGLAIVIPLGGADAYTLKQSPSPLIRRRSASLRKDGAIPPRPQANAGVSWGTIS
jgi:hypothetical protein